MNTKTYAVVFLLLLSGVVNVERTEMTFIRTTPDLLDEELAALLNNHKAKFGPCMITWFDVTDRVTMNNDPILN